jgi:hypothetical protein
MHTLKRSNAYWAIITHWIIWQATTIGIPTYTRVAENSKLIESRDGGGAKYDDGGRILDNCPHGGI